MAGVPRRPRTQAQRVLALLERQALVRPRDLQRLGLSRSALYRLSAEGRVERVGRGLYRLAERATPTHAGMLEVARRAPKAVIGLLSALAFALSLLAVLLVLPAWLLKSPCKTPSGAGNRGC